MDVIRSIKYGVMDVIMNVKYEHCSIMNIKTMTISS